jgi:hypothetical protein
MESPFLETGATRKRKSGPPEQPLAACSKKRMASGGRGAGAATAYCTGASSRETKAISGPSSCGALPAVAGCNARPRSSSPKQAMIKPSVKNTGPRVRARNGAKGCDRHKRNPQRSSDRLSMKTTCAFFAHCVL